MKTIFKKLAILMAFAMIVTTTAPAGTFAMAAEELKLAHQTTGEVVTELFMEAGDEVDLKFLGAPNNWRDLKMAWTSSNTKVATVDGKGLIKAVANGGATITFTCGELTGTCKVNVGAYDITLGIASDRDMSEYTLKLGTEIDLAFYGVQDWKTASYTGVWTSSNESVATVNNLGLVTPVAPGTTIIDLYLTNNDSGVTHNAKAVLVTVVDPNAATPTPEPSATPVPTEAPEVEPTPEPTPAPAGLEAIQKSDNDIWVTFDNVSAEHINTKNIQVWEAYEGFTNYAYEWEIHKVTYDEEMGHFVIEGFDSLVDGAIYTIKYVETGADGKSVTLTEDTFKASVGEIVRMELDYASYKNNQGEYAFPHKAYQSSYEGEEIRTYLFCKFYDANDVDVTEYYKGNSNIFISYDVVEEGEYSSFYGVVTEDERTAYITFDEAVTKPVTIKATFEDYNTDKTFTTSVTMRVEKAPMYHVVKVDDWAIWVDGVGMDNDYTTKSIILNDDYDESTNTLKQNHKIVVWFTDSYGNKYVTEPQFAGKNIFEKGDVYTAISDSDTFTSGGYEIRYEARNPGIIIVGDSIDGDSTSSTISTIKPGTGLIAVSLHNTMKDYNKTLINKFSVLAVNVKAERYINKVVVNSVTVATDSKPAPGETTYDDRFTTDYVCVYVYDQYGDPWGLYNASRVDDLVVNAVSRTDGVGDPGNFRYNSILGCYLYEYDGHDLAVDLGTNRNIAKFNVTVLDALTNSQKTANYSVNVKRPKYDASGNIVVNTSNKVSVANAAYSEWYTTIMVTELSNGVPVNFTDGITYISTKAEYDAIFNKKDSELAVVGAKFAMVYDPDEKLVATAATSGALGMHVIESGYYELNIADTHDGKKATDFIKAGNYKFKLVEITGKDSKGHAVAKTLAANTIRITNDLVNIKVADQVATYLDNVTSMADLVERGFTFTGFEYGIPTDGIDTKAAGARFRLNTRANTITLQDVFFKVYFDPMYEAKLSGYTDVDPWTNAYYYVEVDMDKTIRLDTVSNFSANDSIAKGEHPDSKIVIVPEPEVPELPEDTTEE